MTRHRILLIVFLLAAAAGPFAAHPHAQAVGPSCGALAAGTWQKDAAAVLAFDSRVTDYVTLHRILEGPLPPLRPSRDMRTVEAAMDALAKRLIAARKDARQGDIIAPEMARLFRRQIAACLAPEEIADLLADREEGEPLVPPPLAVNARWPAGVGYNYVPPTLLATLPALPPELQYRIIGRALVLWDHHANLIVDFVPGAFTS